MFDRPAAGPRVPHVSSGPRARRAGWRVDAPRDAALGRSPPGGVKLKRIIDPARSVLRVPASDIGAERGASAARRVRYGATVERPDRQALSPWLDRAFAQETAKRAQAA